MYGVCHDYIVSQKMKNITSKLDPELKTKVGVKVVWNIDSRLRVDLWKDLKSDIRVSSVRHLIEVCQDDIVFRRLNC